MLIDILILGLNDNPIECKDLTNNRNNNYEYPVTNFWKLSELALRYDHF